jgi:hypothetical protein
MQQDKTQNAYNFENRFVGQAISGNQKQFLKALSGQFAKEAIEFKADNIRVLTTVLA